jgi:hypothetical protein
MKNIRQGISEASLFIELQQWCRAGAGSKNHSLHLMSAFASGPAIQALEPFFDVFVSDGNRIEIIVGIDRNGTSRDAIKVLLELQTSHPARVSCKVFHAPSRFAIFHPKLYLYKKPAGISAIVGSANLTLGGLAHNFESLFLYRDIADGSATGEQIAQAWETFAHPRAPLKRGFLRQLTASYASQLYPRLPETSVLERTTNAQQTDEAIRDLWKPISRIKLPRSERGPRRRAEIETGARSRVLVIDVLTETRGTQMQLPLDVVEQFFGIPRRQAAKIDVSQVRGGQLSQPIERPVVISSGNDGTRLMRRIEMPQIDGLERPLIAIFLRSAPRRFAYVLLRNGTGLYRQANQFLQSYGQQPAHAERRYHINRMGSAAGELFLKAANQS